MSRIQPGRPPEPCKCGAPAYRLVKGGTIKQPRRCSQCDLRVGSCVCPNA